MKNGFRRGSIILTFLTDKNSVGCICYSLHSCVAGHKQQRSDSLFGWVVFLAHLSRRLIGELLVYQ